MHQQRRRCWRQKVPQYTQNMKHHAESGRVQVEGEIAASHDIVVGPLTCDDKHPLTVFVHAL